MRGLIKEYAPILILLVLYLFFALYLGSFKIYMYEDEVLSYTSANSQSGMYISTEPGVWYDNTLVENAITAAPGHCFDYSNTLKNSFSDNHPPMYTMLIHTVCSFFPGEYSKWFGLIVNYIAGAGCVTAFYFLAMELFGKRRDISAAASLVFISSLGYIDTLLFIRNYIYFMMAVIISMLLHIHYMRKKEEPVVFFILLYASTFLGMMSHYYFAVVLFYIASYYCLTLLFQKKWFSFGKYVLTMAVAAGTVILVLPDIIDDILHSESGSGNFAIRGISDLRSRYQTTYIIYNQELFGGFLKLFVLAVIAYLVFDIYRNKKITLKEKLSFGIILWTCVWYYLIGSATLTYLASRYLSPIYPFIVLLIVYFCDEIICCVFRNHRFGLVIMVLLFMSPVFGKMKNGLVDSQKLEMLRLAESKSDDYCLFDAAIPIEENFFELEKYKGFMPIVADTDLNTEKITGAEEIVVYALGEETAEEIRRKIQNVNPRLNNMSRLYVAYYSNAYVLN